jgi:hypothetical protein
MGTETQQILNEIRMTRAAFDDLSLQMRIDTPWMRVRENVRHAINTLKEIPILSRFFVMSGLILLTIPLVLHLPKETKLKLCMFAIDCFGLAFVTVGY